MDYIVFGAGKTASLISRYFSTCSTDDRLIGFFDFMGNNPFSLPIVRASDIARHKGEFIAGSVMTDTIKSIKEIAFDKFRVSPERIKTLDVVIPSNRVDEHALSAIKPFFSSDTVY